VFLRPWYAESRASAKRRLQRIRPRFLFFSARRFGTCDACARNRASRLGGKFPFNGTYRL